METIYSQKNYIVSSSKYETEVINLNSHNLFFSPSTKIVKYTPIKDTFFLLISFHSFDGVTLKNKTIDQNIENGLIHLEFNLDYSKMDFTSPCITELVIDIKKINLIQSFLENAIRVNYVVHLLNPLLKDGLDKKDNSLISYTKNSTGGSTDPIDDFPIIE